MFFLFWVFIRQKRTINENVSFTEYAPGIRPPDCSKLAINRKNGINVTTCRNDDIVIFFAVASFLLPSLVTGPSFMSILSLFLELWQSSFIRDWSEIRKSEIPLYEFSPISGDCGEFVIPNLPQMSVMKCYWMLQNARVTVTAFTVSELLRENQPGM